MHEMSVVGAAVDAICQEAQAVGAEKVVMCRLLVGEARDFHEEFVQAYFDWFSKGTPAEGVKVIMDVAPLRYACDVCSHEYGYDVHESRIVFLDPEEEREHAGDNGGYSEEPQVFCHPGAGFHVTHGYELEIVEIGVE